jgi:multidrug efflux pump subunit AcrB
MNLPRWSIRNPTIIVLGVLLFSIWGLATYLRISRREDPEIKISIALVVTVYPGASAEAVEQQVTRKLEDKIDGLTGLDHITSISRANLSVIDVNVRYDTDTDIGWQKLRSRVAEARKELPESVVGPDVIDNFGDTTAMIIAFTGAGPRELAELAKELKAELRHVRPVGDMTIYGDVPEMVYVEGTAAELARSGLTPLRMMQAVKARNLRIPAGVIRSDRYQVRVEPTGAYSSLHDIEATVLDVSETTGQPLHLGDLFRVRRSLQSPPDTKLLASGQGAVALGVVMRRGFNVVQLGREVREVLKRFEQRLPPGVRLDVVHDSPRQVDEHVSSFMKNLLEGLVIVVLCMWLFMGWRPALISATAIPLSVLMALAVMPLLQIDLEMVSIAAFIVALGMLVDDNIIIVDNVDVKLRQGMPPEEAAWRGTAELTGPVVVGTLGNCFAFLPMLLLTREVGAYVRSLPLVLSISLLGSLIVALTVAPLVARHLLRRSRHGLKPVGQNRAAALYRRFLRSCLRHRLAVLALTVAALAGAGVLLFAGGFSFFPEAQRDQFTVDVWLKEGSSIEETERVARLVDAELRRDPDVRSTLVYVGTGGPRFYITVMPEFQSSSYAQVMVNTKSADATPRVVDRFNARTRTGFTGARVFARKLIMGMPIAAPIALRVSGPDISTLRRLSTEVQAILRQTPGTDQVQDDVGDDVPSLRIDVDGERAARVGVTHTDVALTFLATHHGLELTRFPDGDREIPVVLRLRDAERNLGGQGGQPSARAAADLGALPVASSITGEKVPLSSVATVKAQFGPGVIRRHANRRAITVQAWNQGRLANDIVLDAWPKIERLRLPPGYRVAIAGEKEELDRAFGELLLVFVVILASIVGLLAVQVGTMRRVVVALVAVPLSLVGAAIGLYCGGYSFSFMAFLGVVSLAGMGIKNSVVWLEFVERARAEGGSISESVVEAGIYRLRPILLTSATTLGGLLPLALFGGSLFEPMAWGMIAGLAMATVLTLVVVPVCYSLLLREASAPDGGSGELGVRP